MKSILDTHRRNRLACAAAGALLGCSAHAWAVSVSLPASKDNTLYQDEGGMLSNGAGADFFVGNQGAGSKRRGLLAFSLSSIPAGSTVNGATLTLNMNRSISFLPLPLELHTALKDWGEGTSDAGISHDGGGVLASTGDATWLNTFFNTGTWTTPGGDYATTASAVGSVPAVGTVTIASSPGLVADVQSWVNTPANNFGWVLLTDETQAPTAMRFYSRQSGGTVQPMLTIDYTPAVASASTWNVDANGNWSSTSNWNGGVPNSPGATANFGTIITSGRVITVDSPQTVGTLNFSSPISYTIFGTATLTMDVTSGQASVIGSAGLHTIAAPLNLNDDTTFSLSAGSGIVVSSDLIATGKSVTKQGSGSVQFANIRAGALTVGGGLVKILPKGSPNSPAGTIVVGSLSIDSGGMLDLTNNSAVIDYTGSVGGLVGNVRQHLQNGRLTTSSGDANHKLGYGDNALLNKGTFAGQTVDASSVLIKYTYAGDANLDGQVDVTDLGALATNWQTNSVWTGGDFDYSGFVDVTDLGALATNWQAGVGNPLGPGSLEAAMAAVGLSGVSVPEPATVGIIGICLAAAASRRRSR